MGASAVPVLASATRPVPRPAVWPAVVVFFVVELAAAWLLAAEARRRGGAASARLWCASAGTGVFGAALLLSVSLTLSPITDATGAITGVASISRDISERGMPPDVIERAFEPFYTTKPKGSGTGLGLATVYGIATAAGGDVRLYSEAGIGTTVTILLPAVETTAQAGSVAAVVPVTEPATGTSPHETILMAEDEDDLRQITARILTCPGTPSPSSPRTEPCRTASRSSRNPSPAANCSTASVPCCTRREPAAGEAVKAVDLPLAAPASGGLVQDFTAVQLPSLRHAVHDSARACGLTGEALDDFVVAVHELTTNAVRHGGGRGRIELRRAGDTLLCDIIDHGTGFPDGVPAPAGPPSLQTPGGRGLWLARHLTDTMLITDGPAGVTVSVTVCLPPTAPGGPQVPTVAHELGNVQVEIAPGVLVRATTGPGPSPPPGIATGPDPLEDEPEPAGAREP